MCHRQSRSTESNAALRSMKAMKSARSFRNSRAFSTSNRMAEMCIERSVMPISKNKKIKTLPNTLLYNKKCINTYICV